MVRVVLLHAGFNIRPASESCGTLGKSLSLCWSPSLQMEKEIIPSVIGRIIRADPAKLSAQHLENSRNQCILAMTVILQELLQTKPCPPSRLSPTTPSPSGGFAFLHNLTQLSAHRHAVRRKLSVSVLARTAPQSQQLNTIVIVPSDHSLPVMRKGRGQMAPAPSFEHQTSLASSTFRGCPFRVWPAGSLCTKEEAGLLGALWLEPEVALRPQPSCRGS